MKKFIIKRMDGGISIGVICDNENPDQEYLDNEISKWAQSSAHQSDYHQFEERFPDDPDGYFHDAYDHSRLKGVFIDMDKARNIHMDNLRKIRQQKFIDLGFPNQLHPDVEAMILDDDTKKQLHILRDFPSKTDLTAIDTPAKLRNFIPECLK